MIQRLTLVCCLLVTSVSCLTVSDLEEKYPRYDCPSTCPANERGVCVCPKITDCPDGDVCCPERSSANAEGDCVVDPNWQPPPSSDTDSGSTNNAQPCNDSSAEGCCVDGVDCCEPETEGCCESDEGIWTPCEVQPGNSGDTVSLSNLAIAIGDMTSNCQADSTNPGPDLYGVDLLLSGGEALDLSIVFIEFGEGATSQSPDELAAVLDAGPDTPTQECFTGEVASLGCGGYAVLQVAQVAGGNSSVPASETLTLRIYETGPQCDGVEDTYGLTVCDESRLSGGQDQACMPLAEALEGYFEITVSAELASTF